MIRIDLATLTITPDAEPYWSAISSLPPDTWSDLTDHGYPGVGYWPEERTYPTYDAVTHKLGADVMTVDAKRKVVVVTQPAVPLSAAELAAIRKARVPVSVSPRQIRQAMTRAKLRDSVENAVAASDQDTQDWYEFATEFRRDNEVVVAFGKALGVSDTQLDDLWLLAGSL